MASPTINPHSLSGNLYSYFAISYHIALCERISAFFMPVRFDQIDLYHKHVLEGLRGCFFFNMANKKTKKQRMLTWSLGLSTGNPGSFRAMHLPLFSSKRLTVPQPRQYLTQLLLRNPFQPWRMKFFWGTHFCHFVTNPLDLAQAEVIIWTEVPGCWQTDITQCTGKCANSGVHRPVCFSIFLLPLC